MNWAQRAVWNCFVANGAMTDDTLVKLMYPYTATQTPSGIRSRRKELVDQGRIEEKGLKPNGRKRRIWGVV